MGRRFLSSVAGLSILLLLAPAPAAECSVKSKQKQMGEARDDAALVYFIRTKKFQGKARTFFVYADEHLVGTLDNNCYTFAYLPPGEHLLWMNFAKITETVDLEAGEVYYFNVWPKGANLDFQDVGRDWGQSLIETVKLYCQPTDKEVLKSETHIAERLGKAEKTEGAKPEGQYWASYEKSVGRWPHADLSAYPVLALEDFVLTDPKIEKRNKKLQVLSAAQRVTDMVEREIEDGLFAEVRREPLDPAGGGTVILRGEITRYKPGSRASRAMLIGTSNAYFDFKVTLIDAASGEELADFSGDRTWFWGGDMGESVGIEEMEESFAYELSLYLRECRTGERLGPDSTKMAGDVDQP